jgi:hypothetical protein
MTPKQRMAAAMAGSAPDRVPVMCQMSIGHMLLQTGAEPARFWHAADAFADGLVKMRSLYGFDGILVSLHGHSAGWERRVLAVEQGPDGDRVRWKNGDTTFFPFDDLPVVHPARPPVRPEFDRFDPESLPAETADIPVSQGLRFALDPEHLFDVLSIVRGKAGGEFSIHGEVTSPLDYFLDLFGFEQAMIECLDPPPLGRVDLADAKKRIGGKFFIKGNIDPVHVLLSGSMELVREDARSRIATGKPGGGYILSTACSIAPRTPRENVCVLAEAAEAGGVY